MKDKARQRSKARVEPFIVLLFKWHAHDRTEPDVQLTGFSWTGWMASPPADWSGAVEAIAACAPPGARAEVAANHGDGEGSPLLLFPMKPPGAGAPWLDSEETVRRDDSSPRIIVLSTMWEFEGEDVPREWSEAWHEAMTAKALRSTKPSLERALLARGFGDMESMGEYDRPDADSYWANAAMRLAPGWKSRREARALEREVPAPAPAKASKAL